MDGFLSAELLNRFNGSKVVGTYDKNILCLSDGVSVEDCLFVDCDMNRQDLVSIGNHMRLLDDGMSDKSFNPNVHFGITTYTDKFPYATAFLIAAAIEIETSPHDHLRMAYADSTIQNTIKYGRNMRNWSSKMEHPSVDYVLEESNLELDNTFRISQTSQAFVSKRFYKARYIETLNEALKGFKLVFEPLIQGKKYLVDTVGKNTVVKYSQDIISYAEIFTNEYSVTYDQEIEWK